jgi:hypothetical protein
MKEYIIDNKKVEVKSSNQFFYVTIDEKKYDVYFESLFDREKPKGKKHGLDLSISYLQEVDPTISDKTLDTIVNAITEYVNNNEDDEQVFMKVR